MLSALTLLLFISTVSFSQTNTFPASGNVGIGTASPTRKLDIVGDGVNLENTTHANLHGIIYKAGVPFISTFNYGDNGTVTTSGGNTFIGVNAGNFTMGDTATSTSHASYNTGVGNAVLHQNTTGYHNTAVGYASLEFNTTGTNNTAIGFQALMHNTTGNNNSATGYVALYYNTTGKNNSANGHEALYWNTTGIDNTATGYTALFSNTTASYNTADGYAALHQNTTGTGNTATGVQALFSNTTGNYNTATGYGALDQNIIGNYNTTTGYGALDQNIIGNYNTAEGYLAGKYIANGSTADTGSSSSVFIGANVKSLTASDNNEIVIGYNATGAGSNSVVLGNSSITKTLLQGNVLIGKTSQTNTSYKLDVNGDVRANKVVVNTTGADFVFDSTYQLITLDSLNSYINVHHHLPDIPSARQMQQQGMSLGEAYTRLLQKMEEMTLRMIDMQKQINELKKENQLHNHSKTLSK
jgi:hypothetical protein